MSPPQRFNPQEWVISNQRKNTAAEQERALAQRLIAESSRLAKETDDTVRRTQADVKKKLNQRISDIRFWKSELDDKLDRLRSETEALLAYKVRVEKALEATAEPFNISQTCLANREGRRGIDLNHDDVQKELMKEVEVIKGVMELLKRSHEEVAEQARLNKRCQFNLEKDLADKFQGLSLDEYCEALTNTSPVISFKSPSVIKIQSNSVSPEEWVDFSHKNIEAAERERNNSGNLRSFVDGILAQTCNDLRTQRDNVNEAFRRRLKETREAKERLEGQLTETLRQIVDQQENIKSLAKAIEDKDIPMKLSHTRLDTRSQRPNVELCHDAVQSRLVAEVGELNDHIARLTDRRDQSNSSLKGLRRQKLSLEEDIETKSITIYTDDVQCMGMRKSINLQQF